MLHAALVFNNPNNIDTCFFINGMGTILLHIAPNYCGNRTIFYLSLLEVRRLEDML